MVHATEDGVGDDEVMASDQGLLNRDPGEPHYRAAFAGIDPLSHRVWKSRAAVQEWAHWHNHMAELYGSISRVVGIVRVVPRMPAADA